MTAGIETLKMLKEPGVWEGMEAQGAKLMAGLGAAAQGAGIDVSVSRLGTMFGLFFNPGPVTDWDSAAASDTERFANYFRGMLAQGIYLAPSQFEAGFLSTAHGDAEIDKTIAAAERVMDGLV